MHPGPAWVTVVRVSAAHASPSPSPRQHLRLGVSSALRALGRATLAWTRLAGATLLVSARAVLHLPSLWPRELRRALLVFGAEALPLTLGVAAITGATVVLQAGIYANRFGARLYAGWAAGYTLLWEFGPLLLGMVLAARVGARNAAELAVMGLDGQLEGLRGVGLEPFRLLVAPRVAATAVATLALAAVAFLAGTLVEILAALTVLRLPPRVFLASYGDMLGGVDLAAGLAKALAFGLAIAVTSTTAGLRARPGAAGVGHAAAEAVVSGSTAIFLIDLFATPILLRWLA